MRKIPDFNEFRDDNYYCIVPAIIAGVAALAGAGIAAATSKRNRDQQEDWSDKHFERDQQWREEDIQREDTAVQRTMTQFQDAGLHPHLVAGGGGGAMLGGKHATQSGGRMPKPTGESVDFQGAVGNILSAYQATEQMKLMDAERRNIEADTTRQSLENQNLVELHDAQIQRIDEEIASSQILSNLTEQEQIKVIAETHTILQKAYLELTLRGDGGGDVFSKLYDDLKDVLGRAIIDDENTKKIVPKLAEMMTINIEQMKTLTESMKTRTQRSTPQRNWQRR